MNALDALRTRRSVRMYKPGGILPGDLIAILDCGRLAPCGHNAQGWRFVVITDAALRQGIADITTHGKFIAQAGACVAVFCSADAITPLEDASAATAAMLYAAHAKGYGACWIGVYKNDQGRRIQQLLGADAGWEIMTLFALGVPEGDAEQKDKKPLEDIVVYNGFH